MQRREFITLLGGAAITWPLAARAQQPGKVWRVGFVAGGERPIPFEAGPYIGFLQGMRELGYVAGENIVIEWRFAEGRYGLFPDFAAEFARLRVDVIVVGAGLAVPAMRQANPDTPIVIGYSVDPVGTGLVASLARPGGNTTGLASAIDDIVEKQVELLIAAVLNLSRVAVLTNPANSFTSLVIKDIEAAAQKARLSLLPLQAQNLQDIENAFNAMTKERVGALVVVVDAFLFAHRQRIAELALKSRLPSMFGNREYVQAGGLMSYGDSLQEFYRHAASYVNKIFKGAKPEELPIEQPVKFNLVINRKTADTWADDSAAALHICRRGDRIEMQFAAVHESASGT